MVIRILTGKDVAGAVRYNEKKVGEGQAQRIEIANYPDNELAEKHAEFRLQLLEQQARLNSNIKRPSVHLAIAFHPTEVVPDHKLQRIGKEIMTEAGYGKQPYLMYRHDDTQHPHIHIVTVSIDPNGRKITDQFIKKRLNKIRQDIEKRHGLVRAERVGQRVFQNLGDGQQNSQQHTIGKLLKQTLDDYTFGSVASFRQFLSLKNVLVNVAAGRSKSGITFQMMDDEAPVTRPIKASSFEFKPTLLRLKKRFAAQEEEHKRGCIGMSGLIHSRLTKYINLTEAEYRATLQQVGIQVHSRGGGYLYVQERPDFVALEAELPNTFHKQTLLTHFADRTERRITVQGDAVSILQLGPTQTVPSPVISISPPVKGKNLLAPTIRRTPINDHPSSTFKPQTELQEEALKQVEKSLSPAEQHQNLSVVSKKEKKNQRKNRPRL